MDVYDTIIVGGGPAGVIAGIHLKGKTMLLEKNDMLLKKMLLTGGGRCNLTNKSSFNEFLGCFYGNGKFYRDAFSKFFNKDIIKLLEDNGCKTKTEEDKRVFPVTDNSKTVVDVLTSLINSSDTEISLNSSVDALQNDGDYFLVRYNKNHVLKSKNVILATGGNCYPKTGSAGDGYAFAKSLGHTLTKQMGGLSPIKIRENWIKNLQAITVDARMEFRSDRKIIGKSEGSVLFTHNGLSGFVILDNSMLMEEYLRNGETVEVSMDFCGHYSYDLLDEYLKKYFKENSNKKIKTCLHQFLPKRMGRELLVHLGIDSDKILNQVTKKERMKIIDSLKHLTLTVDRVLEEDAMVTGSGVKMNQINPVTFESKIADNLYIVGELIEGCGICGGYNLQQAYSTGFTASMSINEVLL